MMEFKMDWDDETKVIFERIAHWYPHWYEHINHKVPEKLAHEAQKHFEPMLHVRPQTTNRLRDSIQAHIQPTGEGWKIDYYGLLHGLYIDEGNFDPGVQMFARDKGLKYFPVDARLGEKKRFQYIHGMGAKTPGAPTHFSQKTVDWLAEGKAIEIAYDHVMMFLNEVIGI